MASFIGKRQTTARLRYFKILKYQAVTVLIAVAGIGIYDWVAAYSVLAGGFIYLAPNAYSAWRHFGKSAEITAHATLAALYADQIWKMALMGMAFALVFALVEPLSVFSIFGMLILMQIMHVVLQVSIKKDS